MKVLIAAGGTGGHIYPAIAIAEGLRTMNKDCDLLFVCSKRKLEKKILSEYNVKVEQIATQGIIAVNLKGKVIALFSLVYSFFQVARILNQFKPDIVLGMGGYVSFPVASLAVALRYRVALCEQNSIPGTTNKILGRFVNAFFASFDITKNYIQGKHIIISGNPLRSSLLEKRNEAGDKQENKQEHTFTILIIGGSQGSRNINEAVVAILPYILKENGINIRIMHQTGYEDYEWVKHSYEQTGTCGSVVPFIDDMGSAYISADLIVSRAGATVISEILFFGKPSILIPHPFSAKNHQEHNADILVKSGAAIKIIDFPENRELLAQKIVTLIHDKARLQEMGKRAHLLAKPDATKTIVNWCFEKGNGETDV